LSLCYLYHPDRHIRRTTVTTEAEATAEKGLFAGISIDPATWEDPKQTFPGEIITSEFRLATEEYRAETEYRPAITEDLPQWDLRIKRLDAIRVELDGSHSDVIYYGGIDMVRYNARTNDGRGGLVPISSRYPKEWDITNAHKKLFGTVQPPEVLIGKLAMFDFFQTRAYGTVTAKRVLLPASVLPPDWTFDGEKIVFTARERDEDAPVDSGAGAPSTDGSASLLPEVEALALIPAAINGQKATDVAGIIAAIPQNARLPNVVNGIATQELLEELKTQGKIAINGDGVIEAVGA
jgi:hypothetical protein